ncbi:uncharacterized protein K02A2.6-like [Ostrea edulis]|uniref:uncharacterized protein K02A2.6-like n=1 Tax=Ostrea edulis TaxID=37623 RepID=UPI0024AF2043|nr:uncharacterized protein K02A2.6-like [Ostrea edulis]
MRVNVNLNSQAANLDLFVVPHDGPALLGRDWLGKLRLNWQEIKTLRSTTCESTSLNDLLETHKELFSPGIGTLKHIKGSVTVNSDAKPVFLKARTVPYSLRTKVEQELDKLQTDGIIEPVAHSNWATPIVPAIKREKSFQDIKELICSDKVLCHYDPKLPLKLAADASPYGIGSVLSHVFPDGTERPIAFSSRTLNQAEKAYSHIDKEALALYWGYQYDIEFRGTKAHGNADTLSRVQLPSIREPLDDEDPIDLFYSRKFDDLQIRRETQREPVLSQILDCVTRGHFPQDCDDKLKPYYNRKDELNVYQGCVTWGNRVIIPDILREKVITELHSGHIGIVKMKAVARSYVWWPKIDEAIEEICKACYGCKRVQNAPSAAPVHPWNFLPKAWHRLHIDFAGPFHHAMFLIIVDAYSKWPEVFEMKSTTSTATINTLRTLFIKPGKVFQQK